ncbi:enoyl-CoA hydratase-related protein [Pseudooceanicola sp.]|uniref:enoyl-CoA hydratase/isomerase family protein n=1 Tax=Pseudooceanicola sp. TaxID=1914328 RepID=UPI0026232E70|nr:enoyl-CoA hydratase-related protein [Pseudooceanicola sp.]MDF1857054.1 enoyl-CoA hydratase-related protein [Pseudooceanicola sp.]
MATSPEVLTVAFDGAIAIVTINNPTQRNALSAEVRKALASTVAALDMDPACRVLILQGVGGTFSAGGDVTSMGNHTVESGMTRLIDAHDCVRVIVSCRKPVIAAVEGWAVGAGMSLALLCDSIVAAEDAKFAAVFGNVGLAPDMGMLRTLPLRVGHAQARQLLLYGETIKADAALTMGLVDKLTPSGGAFAEARRLAGILQDRAPLPIAMIKSELANGLEDLLRRESLMQTLMYQTSDHAEGRTAFLEKRKASFRGE